MNILLDTSILLYITRSKNYNGIVNFINPKDFTIYISIVSEAEIKSIALRKRWGANRINVLNEFLEQALIIDVSQSFLNIYAEIDAYSQRANPNFAAYNFDTPRNMGKNDLWIASLAALLSLTLITADSDFDHLHKVFFDVQKLIPTDFAHFF